MSQQQYDVAGQATGLPRNGLAGWAMGLGIAGLVLSVVGVGVVLGVVGLIMGIVALSRGTRRGAAVTGIVTGALSLVVAFLALIIFAIMVPALGGARQKAMETRAMVNIRSLNIAVTMYAADWNDVYPDHLAGSMKYLGGGAGSGTAENVIKDPRWGGAAVTLPPVGDIGAMKVALDAESDFYYAGAGMSQRKILHPNEFIILYDKDMDPRGHRVVGFMDGHVERMNRGSPELQRAIDATNRERAAAGLGPLPAGLSGPVER